MMADISSVGMVSYYNSLAMYRQQQQQSAGQESLPQQVPQQQPQQPQPQQPQAGPSNAAETGQQYWYGYPGGYPHAPHHQPPPAPQQYLEHGDVLPGWAAHPHAHHYSHLQYPHHQAAYQQYQQNNPQQQPAQPQQQPQQPQQPQQQQQQQPAQIPGVNDWSGDDTSPPGAVGVGEPSPPITVSGSEGSSPGTPSTSPVNNNNNSITNNNNTNPPTTGLRPTQMRSPFEWMKKPSYQNQPNPGKTRTKDKYRVVYTDYQRLELEKEFHYSRYITIRRKAELAASLDLSERQVKIWFQNRRAKERKQVKKREELEQKDAKSMEGVPSTSNGMGGGGGGFPPSLGGMMPFL